MFDKNPNLLQFSSIDRNLLDIAGFEKLAMYGLTDQARIKCQLGSKDTPLLEQHSFTLNELTPASKH